MADTKRKVKLNARQKRALERIKLWGEDIVIEGGWQIYTSINRFCPFTGTGPREVLEVMDSDAVRAKMVRRPAHEAEAYRLKRSIACREHSENAISLIQR